MSTDVAAILADSPWAGRAGLRWQPGVAAVASPMCQAVDWTNWVVSAEGAPDALFDASVARFGRAGVLDLLALCGYYALLAMVLNTARPDLPDGVAPPLSPLEGT